MAKDIPDDWQDPDEATVEVVIPRHTFMEFALRAPEPFAIARAFSVDHGVAKTTITFVPNSKELMDVLRRVVEPGETVIAGNQSWTPERCKLQGFDE